MSESVEMEAPPMGNLPAAPLVRSSTELGKLFEALSAAQGEMTDPAKNKTADLGRGGRYSYADLADLLKIIRPVFAKHGLCLLQFPVNPRRGEVTIVTRIGHKSGQWMESDLTMLVGDGKPQTIGSSVTYGRRYSAGAVAGMSPDDDEDGKLAQDAGAKQQAHEESAEGFQPGNPAHEAWLTKVCLAQKVPAAVVPRLREAMTGLPADAFDAILKRLYP